MNIEKIFAKVIKAKCKNQDVTVVTNFANAQKLLKLLFALPNSQVANIEFGEPEWRGCYDLFLLSTGGDDRIFCQPAIGNSGIAIKGSGLYIVDTTALGAYKPEDFILDEEDTSIKLIGGD